MKITLSCIALITSAFLIYVFNQEGPLEKLKLGPVHIEPGDTLLSACRQIEGQMENPETKWTMVVDQKISDKKFLSTFSGGGSGLMIGLMAQHIDCRYQVIENKRLIVFY